MNSISTSWRSVEVETVEVEAMEVEVMDPKAMGHDLVEAVEVVKAA
jgi:hypothetical protein